MRKTLCLFLVALCILSLWGCGSIPHNAASAGESLTDTITAQIEADYAKDAQLPAYMTTLGMIELADKYTAKWKQVAEEYYNKLAAYKGRVSATEDYKNAKQLRAYVTDLKQEWDGALQGKIDVYAQTLQAEYGNGSVKGPLLAEYKRTLHKEWALQLIGIYQQLSTE